jgi:hypothetical protein
VHADGPRSGLFKPITTQMNDLPLDLSQSVSQVHIPMHPYLSPSHSL